MTDPDQEDSSFWMWEIFGSCRVGPSTVSASCGSFMVFCVGWSLGLGFHRFGCVMNAKRAPQEKRNIRYVR